MNLFGPPFFFYAQPTIAAGLGGGAYSFTNAEAAAVVAAMTTEPDNVRKAVIDTLVGALKTAGVWTKTELLYVLGAHDSQAARLNWKSPGSNTLTAVNSPTFTTDRGYTGDGASSYLNSGINASALTVFLQDDAHAGVWFRTAGSTGAYGLGTDSGSILRISGNLATNPERLVRINSSTNLTTDDNVTTGHVVGVRRDSANQYSYRNGGGESTGAQVSQARTAAPVTILRALTTYSDQQILFGHLGGQLSSGEITAYYNALNAYKTAIGA